MFWKILKIEPTADKNKIRAAYRDLLSGVNPEDKPEEFKALRQAYEEALAWADAHAKDTVKTPMELWQEELAAIYDDFSRRNELSEWQKLLNEDICLSLDGRMACEDALLQFLMDHYFLSHEIWVYFDSQFSWLERQEELYDSYPQDFIDYIVVNGIHFNDTLPMKMFIPGKDGDTCNAYLGEYYHFLNAENEEDMQKALESMLSLPEQHPYGTARILMYQIDQGDPDAEEKLLALQKEYPEDPEIGLLTVEHLLETKQIEKCEELIEELKKTDKDSIRLRWFEAGCLAAKGDYQEAVKTLDRLLQETGGNGQLQYELSEKRREYNDVLIDTLQEKLQNDPDNVEDRVNLAWAYLENDRLQEAKQQAALVPQDYEDRFGYYNLNGSIAISMLQYEEAAELFKKLAEIAENLPADSEKNILRRGRTGEIYSRIGYSYFCLNEEDKAEEYYQKALASGTNRNEILTHLSEISLNRHQYEKALEYANTLIKENPGSYEGYLTIAYAYYYMHMDRDAYNALDHALDLCRSDLNAYTLKARILMRNEADDGAKEIIDFLKDSGLKGDVSVLFVEGVFEDDCRHDEDAALAYYEKALAGMKGSEKMYEYGAELLYRTLLIKGDRLNVFKEEDRKIMLDLADRGLQCNPEHYGLTDYKAWLKSRGAEYGEALQLYQKLAALPEHSANVEAEIGYIYYQDLEHEAERSLEYYLKAIEYGGGVSCHFYAGMCCMYMMKLDEAEEQFLLLREKDPKAVDAPYRLSFVYAMKGDNEKALEEAEKAIDIVKDRDGDQTQYFVRKAILLRRLNRIDESVEAVRETMKRYGYPYGNRMIFQTYAHAGRLEEAAEHLREWANHDPNSRELCDCGILLHMYQEDFDGASLERKASVRHLHPDRLLEVDQIISEYYGDYRRQLRQLKKWLQYRQENDAYDISRIQGTLAMCCWRLKDYEKAREYAALALQETNKKIAEYEPDKLLFMARRIRLLAILGRELEARDQIEQCRTMPFCQSCPEHTCKDVDIFRMEAEEIFGNYARAYEIACVCADRYPDEEDFIIARHNLKRKVK